MDSLIDLVEKDQADTNKINHLNALCNEYIINGEYETALNYGTSAQDLGISLLNKAQKSDVKKSLHQGLATSYNHIGTIHSDRGDFSLALEYFEKSIKINK